MEWWKGVAETRLLVAPGECGVVNGEDGSLLSLRNPKTDGGLYAATPVDPVFVLLPIFYEARMKKGSDPGKFRQLDEIIFVDGYPGYQHLYSMAEACMELVCEIKVADAVRILSEYEPWLKLLCQHMELDLLDTTSIMEEAGTPLTTTKSNQEKEKTEDKSKKTGRQAKKAKVGTQSRNIQDMFRKASRNR